MAGQPSRGVAAMTSSVSGGENQTARLPPWAIGSDGTEADGSVGRSDENVPAKADAASSITAQVAAKRFMMTPKLPLQRLGRRLLMKREYKVPKSWRKPDSHGTG